VIVVETATGKRQTEPQQQQRDEPTATPIPHAFALSSVSQRKIEITFAPI
jgi:hypothetical protein